MLNTGNPQMSAGQPAIESHSKLHLITPPPPPPPTKNSDICRHWPSNYTYNEHSNCMPVKVNTHPYGFKLCKSDFGNINLYVQCQHFKQYSCRFYDALLWSVCRNNLTMNSQIMYVSVYSLWGDIYFWSGKI